MSAENPETSWSTDDKSVMLKLLSLQLKRLGEDQQLWVRGRGSRSEKVFLTFRSETCLRRSYIVHECLSFVSFVVSSKTSTHTHIVLTEPTVPLVSLDFITAVYHCLCWNPPVNLQFPSGLGCSFVFVISSGVWRSSRPWGMGVLARVCTSALALMFTDSSAPRLHGSR